LENYTLDVNYVDRLDNMTVEFPHSHTRYYEIYYVEKGRLPIMADGVNYELSKNKFLLLAPGTKHGSLYTPEIDKQYFVIVFDFIKKNIDPAYQASMQFEQKHIEAFFNTMKNRTHMIAEDKFDAGQYINKLEREVTEKKFGWEFITRSYYIGIITMLLRNIIEPADPDMALEMTNMPIAITKYLHANYEKSLSVQDVADEFHVSARHISRIFKEYFGTSLSRTLTLYRISYAKNYLIDTDYSLDRIAEEIGLSSASALSKLFKETEGISITEYRSKIKNHR